MNVETGGTTSFAYRSCPRLDPYGKRLLHGSEKRRNTHNKNVKNHDK